MGGCPIVRMAVLPVPMPRCTRPGASRFSVASAATCTGGMARPQVATPARGPRQHRVAVGEEHLAVGDPRGVVPERLHVRIEVHLVDVGHHADAEPHGAYDTSKAARCGGLGGGGGGGEGMSARPRALPRGVGAALLAAALFGASTPLAKLLLREV